MRFRYTKLSPNAQTRPYLNVFLGKGYHTSDVVMALVDSGADYPIFPMETATDYLKLDLLHAETWTFSGTTGLMQTARLAKVWMTILQPASEKKLYEVLTTCAFCDTFQMSGGVLLGQIGFFSCFKTTFHQPDQYFQIDQIIKTVG